MWWWRELFVVSAAAMFTAGNHPPSKPNSPTVASHQSIVFRRLNYWLHAPLYLEQTKMEVLLR